MGAIIVINDEFKISKQDIWKIKNIEDLKELHRRLTQHLVTNGEIRSNESGYIRSDQAKRIAKQRGINIPPSTLVSACERKTIPSARKQNGRWEFLEEDFEFYLNNLQAQRNIS